MYPLLPIPTNKPAPNAILRKEVVGTLGSVTIDQAIPSVEVYIPAGLETLTYTPLPYAIPLSLCAESPTLDVIVGA
jgi:hypothetical protein